MPTAARLDPLERLVHPAGPLAARGALAATLVGEEPRGVVEVVHDARLVVHHGDGGRAQAQAAGLLDILEVELDVHLVGVEDAHADAAGDSRLELPPLPHPTGMILDQLAGGHTQRQLDADLLVDVARDAIQLRPIALGRADRLEPVGPTLDDVRHTSQGLDIVDHRRLAERALDRRKRRLDPRPAALAFEALDQSGLLAADVRPGAPVNIDLEVESTPVNILAEVTGLASLGNRLFEDSIAVDVLEPDVDVSRGRLGREAGDQNAFEKLVGVQLHQQPVVERRRLGLVGVDAHERLFPIFRKKRPLQARREPRATTTAQLGILDDAGHLVGVELGQGLASRLIATARLIDLEQMAIGDRKIAGQDRFKLGHVRDLHQKLPGGGFPA